MAHPGTEQLLIGCLMREPSALLQTDTYTLDTNEFASPLYRSVFYAIANIAQENEKRPNEKITVQAVENWLGDSSKGAAIYKTNEGKTTLVDALSQAADNYAPFDSTYLRFKKENLLEELKKRKFDIGSIYVEDAKTLEDFEINDRFNSMSLEEIFTVYDASLNQLKKKLLKHDNVTETQSLNEGMREMIVSLRKNPEIGIPLQGTHFNSIVSGALLKKLYLRSGGSGLGKALPNSARIPTPLGWRTVGAIREGDFLFGSKGKPTKVLRVFPQGMKKVWMVHFEDGRTAKCCSEHLWSFNSPLQKCTSTYITKSLRELTQRPLKVRGKWSVLVPMQREVEYPVKDFEVPPYDYGYASSEEVPLQYLQGSIQQRCDLLNGILDRRGVVSRTGKVTYTTESPGFLAKFLELLQSLGLKGIVTEKISGYRVTITGRREDKEKLFTLEAKRKSLKESSQFTQREEHNAIVKIEELDYCEEMTCFLVDNEDHLFLTENFVVTHNTRSAMADACHIAFPIRYSWTLREWERAGVGEKVLFIITEQEVDEIQRMAMAYLTGINEDLFKRGETGRHHDQVIEEALEVFDMYKDNFYVIKLPNPSITLLKALIREHVHLYSTPYIFYDYIFESPALFNEFHGMNLRTDQILFNFSTELKNLAVELGVFIMSGTQLNAKADDGKTIRNESSIAGARAIINKADMGCIMVRPSSDELATLESMFGTDFQKPNIVTDVFKNRGAEHSQVRIWSYIDLGIMRRKDLFVTNQRLEPIEIRPISVNFVSDKEKEYKEHLRYLNSKKGE